LRRPGEIPELAGIIEAAGSNRLLWFYGNASLEDMCQDLRFVDSRSIIFDHQKRAIEGKPSDAINSGEAVQPLKVLRTQVSFQVIACG